MKKSIFITTAVVLVSLTLTTPVLYHVPYQAWSFFQDDWYKFIVDEYFNIEYYDENKTYSDDATYLTGCNVYIDPEHRNKFIDKKLIVDVTWESFVGKWGKKIYPNRSDRHYFIYGNHSMRWPLG